MFLLMRFRYSVFRTCRCAVFLFGNNYLTARAVVIEPFLRLSRLATARKTYTMVLAFQDPRDDVVGIYARMNTPFQMFVSNQSIVFKLIFVFGYFIRLEMAADQLLQPVLTSITFVLWISTPKPLEFVCRESSVPLVNNWLLVIVVCSLNV